MTNEVLETHVVRYVDVLAAPRPPGGRVFDTSDGIFWQTSKFVELNRAMAPEGDCLETLRAFDGRERFSTVDSADFAAREIIELDFATIPAGNYGPVIASRRSLLSTYLFYQALTYMGRSAGSWLAALERQDANTRERSRGVQPRPRRKWRKKSRPLSRAGKRAISRNRKLRRWITNLITRSTSSASKT
jgi:hypothetical protein